MTRTTTMVSRVTLGTLVFAAACSRLPAEKASPASDAPQTAAQQDCWTKVTEIDMATLAWLAEQADGLRNEDLSLVIDEQGKPQLRKGDVPGSVCDTKVKVRTKALKDRTTVNMVSLEPKGGTSAKLPPDKDFDAVFWTESSVDKFVWPYYHAHRLWDKHIDSVKTKFDSTKTAFAIAHQAPSKPSIPGRQWKGRSASPADELHIGVLENGKVTWIDTDSFLRR